MATTTEEMKPGEIVGHLFRKESGRLVAVLTRLFGPHNLDLAEDVVQDSFTEAINQWSYSGIPSNPAAWIFKVAKNKAINILNREKYKRQYVSDVSHLLQSEWTAEPALQYFFSDQEILDDQLRMMFTCCHPAITTDSQVALSLKTLCGFSIPEIAKAFLTTEENIKKRLVRARQNIREDKIPFEVPQGKELEKRLQAVLETVYLLFNEGYSASKGNDIIRYEPCEEAIRLTEIILQHPVIQNKTNVYALLALMQLNASRFKARQDNDGRLITMEQQDRSLWNRELIENGITNLSRSTSEPLSVYYILAAISACHCTAVDYASTNWTAILSLYDSLVVIDKSPVILLNRTVAVSKVNGAQQALKELEHLKNIPSLAGYYLFYSTQAEFYIQLNDTGKAIESLERATALAPLQAEKDLLSERLSTALKK